MSASLPRVETLLLMAFLISFSQSSLSFLFSQPQPQLQPQPQQPALLLQRRTLLSRCYAVTPKPWGEYSPIDPDSDDIEDSDLVGGDPTDATLLEMYPRPKRGSNGLLDFKEYRLQQQQMALRTTPPTDYTKLKPDDPAFLDMAWPTESGPEATAFAKHMQWRRRLSDGERERWQRWAVYSRAQVYNEAFAQPYQYGVADYVFQQMQREMQQRAQLNAEKGNLVESTAWDTIAYGYIQEEQIEVEAVINCFYSAWNRNNYDEMSSLLLPDEDLEVILPGFEKARGHLCVERLFRRVIKDSKPFGTIKQEVVACYPVGFNAIVHTIETIEPGKALKTNVKKGRARASQSAAASDKPDSKADTKRVFSTLVLRKFNQQWRILSVHSVRFRKSNFLGDRANTLIKRRKRGGDLQSQAQLQGKGGSGDGAGVISKAISKLPEDLRKALGQRGVIPLDPRDVKQGGKKGKSGSSSNNPFAAWGEEQLLELSDSSSSSSSDMFAKARPRYLAGMVDPEATLSKQAFQAVKLLYKAGKINLSVKDTLILDMISSIAKERTPLVEVAYELLVNRPKDGSTPTQRLRAEKAKAIYELQKKGDKGWEKKARDLLRVALEGPEEEEEEDSSEVERRLDEFREQCLMIAQEVERRELARSIYRASGQEGEDEGSEESESGEEEDPEEDDDNHGEEGGRRQMPF